MTTTTTVLRRALDTLQQHKAERRGVSRAVYFPGTSLLDDLERIAKREGVSFNGLVIALLTASVSEGEG